MRNVYQKEMSVYKVNVMMKELKLFNVICKRLQKRKLNGCVLS